MTFLSILQIAKKWFPFLEVNFHKMHNIIKWVQYIYYLKIKIFISFSILIKFETL